MEPCFNARGYGLSGMASGMVTFERMLFSEPPRLFTFLSHRLLPEDHADPYLPRHLPIVLVSGLLEVIAGILFD